VEVLIRIVDHSANPLASKAGDIISICPDNWPWTAAEINNPEYIIVQTQITQAEADALTAPRQNAVTKDGTLFRNYKVNSVPVKPVPARVMVVPVANFRTRFGLKP
jgi:hypothetical protein